MQVMDNVFFVQGLYMDWDQYHSNYSTYESDLAYVKFCEELANETKV